MRYQFIIKCLLILACIITQNCTIKYYNTNKLLNDHRTEGFLDRDHFQVIIQGIPEKGIKGLVFRRESAFRNAKCKVNEEVVEKLIEFNLDHHIRKSNIKNVTRIVNLDEVRKELGKELSKLIEYGYIAFEYYNENHSAVLVYRLYKDDLIEDVESIKPDLKLEEFKEEKNEEKAKSHAEKKV